ncbi:MAG: Crp/Fnr family transcriptional regulator [Proteobacteria bacterium]|nr:Crp/Fnr family transcriptional regulator [Pseudomonadota bacterium]MBU1595737.1 Crp/Fnr family transcriptional regulator [Pseudomonadota bacterium]
MLHTDIDILAELRRPELAALSQCFQTRSYAKKAQIFLPKSEEDLIFIVQAGRVRISLAYDDKEFTLAILERGDVYSTHTRAYVSALEETSLLCAATSVVRRNMLRVPEFTVTMVRVLGEMLKHSIGIIDDLAFRDVQTRLMRFLRFMALQSGVAQPEGTAINLGLTTEQFASLLGTTRQTLSTMLNTLDREGRIHLRGRGSIVIPDLNALDERASG